MVLDEMRCLEHAIIIQTDQYVDGFTRIADCIGEATVEKQRANLLSARIGDGEMLIFRGDFYVIGTGIKRCRIAAVEHLS